MPLPGGAQAQDKTQRARRQVRLVGVRDDGRIEQGRGFQGEFGKEIGADQQLSLFGKFLIAQQEVADLFESFLKVVADLLVSLGEFGVNLVQERADPAFRERHDPGDNLPGLPRIEWPQENA